MKKLFLTLASAMVMGVCAAAPQGATTAAEKSAPKAEDTAKNATPVALTFKEVEYVHRWFQGTQHEFTPKGQEDLTKWKDMITFNFYPQFKDGVGLASVANAVLENYKANGGRVVRTDSKPATETQPAEHLIVVMFPTKDFLEVAFARFKINGGMAMSMVYSHRIYGTYDKEMVSKWFGDNGAATEDALMSFDKIPLLKNLPN